MKISKRLILCCLSLLGVLIVSLVGTLPVQADEPVAPLSDALLWCPLKIAPVANLNGCTDSYTSFGSLLAYLSSNQPNQAGVIWIGEGL
jgi:hypothetical protein